MKNTFTLFGTAALALAALSAQAQFTVDGTASAAEIGTGIGKYQQVATYTGAHSDADRGLKALYVGYTATTLNIMLVSSADAATSGPYKALVMYLNTPGRTGTAAGTRLAGGGDGLSPLKHRPTMDLEVDYGLRMSIGPGGTDVYFSRASYVGTTPSDTYLGQGSKTGGLVTASGNDFAGAKMAYNNTASVAANTSTGWEVEIPLSVLGNGTTPLAVGGRVDLFAAYTDGDGIFTTDVIPQISGQTTALGADPNFTTIAGTQALAYVIGTGVLAKHEQVATKLQFGVYPNPANGAARVSYVVPGAQQNVELAVYNAMGQRVRDLAAGSQTGPQQYSLANLSAGTYLVKLRVGDQSTSQKVVVQ
ncbi:T9SS type A sorting domain-containing protein [Hymenobacter gummosus]|uniref:T9SS type A sorting domain-containing protein n=1 Tax=Hymenobacter gummosus TaxID=1776032 RepID=A0A3S0JG36_9BACT|nr:T9SS type A sorting domain-containing protein [Hymenobacter gummosus]RTQ52139.1 T9SS type A sorting domain-containing protein [Hymenobacter gummosus]